VANEIIIKTKSGAIIPVIKPDAFGLAVAEMEKLDEQLAALELRAKALPKIFESKADYDRAAEIVAERKSIVKIAESVMAPYVEQIKTVKTFVDQQKNIVKNHAEEMKTYTDPAMGEWDSREERAAAAEQKRIQAEKEAQLKRDNEIKAQKDAEAAAANKEKRIAEIREDLRARKITKAEAAKLLKAAGATEEADKARIAAEKEEADAKAKEEAEKLKVKPNTGAVAGVTRRTNYYAECTDENLLLHRVVGEYLSNGNKFGPLRDFVMANQQKIGAKARDIEDDDKMQELYPFVRAWHQKTF
jgi:hypothetical protein